MKYKSLIAAFFAALLLYVSVFAQSAIVGTVTKAANLRAGPGTTYATAGVVKVGQSVTIVGKNKAGTWYHLSDGHWIASFLVKVIGTATPAATPTVTGTRPTSTPTATSTVTPTPTKTPVPTFTPLPTFTPTATVDPITDIKKTFDAALAACGNQCEYSKVEYDPTGGDDGGMVVRFMAKAPDLIWSNDAFKRDVGFKVFYTLKAISTLDVNYDAIAFEFELPVVDKYGNESVDMGISCYFSKEIVKRINYPNIRMRYIVDLADRAYTNPVLAGDN